MRISIMTSSDPIVGGEGREAAVTLAVAYIRSRKVEILGVILIYLFKNLNLPLFMREVVRKMKYNILLVIV